jgi:hypothetical protein
MDPSLYKEVGAVGMNMKLAAMFVLAAVIVHADVTFGQAMGDGGIVGKRKGDGRREDAKRVERGQNDRRFDAKSFGQGRHRASWHSMRRRHPTLRGQSITYGLQRARRAPAQGFGTSLRRKRGGYGAIRSGPSTAFPPRRSQDRLFITGPRSIE